MPKLARMRARSRRAGAGAQRSNDLLGRRLPLERGAGSLRDRPPQAAELPLHHTLRRAARGRTSRRVSCSNDGECASGLCLALGLPDEEDHDERLGQGLCAQLCVSNGDCAGLEDLELRTRVGLECRAIRFGHRLVQACLPSAANPTLTVCAVDGDCPSPDTCRFLRLTAEWEPDGSAWKNQLPSCGTATGGDRAVGQLCHDADDSACESGLCAFGATIDSASNAANLSWTDTAAGRPDELRRCSDTCRRARDCEAPLTCRQAISRDAIGAPVEVETPGGTVAQGLAVPRCILPVGGCVDQVHCLGFDERRDVDPSCCTFGYRRPAHRTFKQRNRAGAQVPAAVPGVPQPLWSGWSRAVFAGFAVSSQISGPPVDVLCRSVGDLLRPEAVTRRARVAAAPAPGRSGGRRRAGRGARGSSP